MNKENCALKLVDEIILYYDARSKKHQIILYYDGLSKKLQSQLQLMFSSKSMYLERCRNIRGAIPISKLGLDP